MDRYSIDHHKMHMHPERLAAWLKGEPVAPIYLEVSPSGQCNCRCRFCGMDFLGYRKRMWDAELLKDRVAHMGRLGLKSIMYAGEGEPFTHPELAGIIEHTAASGVDVAITTNAILMTEAQSERVLGNCCWIKASVNAGSPDVYGYVHGVAPEKYREVIHNLERAAAVRAREGYRCTLGMQMILLPQNAHEATTLAATARDAGMDYLVIKPYSQHPLSGNCEYDGLTYSDMRSLAEELQAMNTEHFNIVFRWETMARLEQPERAYSHCLGLPFAGYIDTDGNMWGCLAYVTDERFLFGNIRDENPEDVFWGPRRTEALRWAAERLDTGECRVNCRLEAVNSYLWQLRHPSHHVNFI